MFEAKYLTARRGAKILRDGGGYALERGEMNPVIFEDFVEEVLDRNIPPVIWEPFAGHTGRSKSMDLCVDVGVDLIACDLEPSDPRIIRRDSTMAGPGRQIGAMLFHPPYFGSTLMSGEDGELSGMDESAYCAALARTIGFAWVAMATRGLVCAVCRDYRYGGERIRLDRWFLSLFVERFSFRLVEVWTSEPDIVLVMEK